MLRLGDADFAELLEAMPDAVAVVDRAGVIRFVNSPAAALFGYGGGDLVGQSIETLVPESLGQFGAAQVTEFPAHPKTRHMGFGQAFTGRRRDGSPFPADISLSRIQAEDGPLVIATFHDRTASRAETLATIIENSHDAIIQETLDGTIIGWSPAAERLYGYSREEVIGKSIMLISPEDRVDEITVILAKVKAGVSTQNHESIRVRKDGTKVSVLLTISPIRYADGPVIGACAIAQDLTDRKRAEHELRRLAAIVEHANDGIVGATLEGVVTSWNAAAERMFGLSRQEVLGKSLLDISPKDRVEEIAGILAKIKAGQPTEPYERVRVRRDGTRAFLSLTTSPVKDEDGVVVGVSATVRDLTNRKSEEQELRRLAAIIEGSNDAIVGATVDGVVTTWNAAAESLYGVSREDVIGKSIMLIEPPDRAEEITSILAKVRAGLPTPNYESVRIRADGKTAFVSLTVSPVKDADGEIVGVSTIGRDVTVMRRSQSQIAEWRARAFAWMEELERFQRLSVLRDFERELKVIELQQEINKLKDGGPPDRGESDDEA